MQQTTIPGVYKHKDRLFTVNPAQCQGNKVYNERLIIQKGIEYRSWNPYRSKLAAALLNNIPIYITPDATVLYLGAAMGTTVSHIADIIDKGIIYAVEHTPFAMKKLLSVSEQRSNIIPLLADANHPDHYSPYLEPVDILYQDISQRNQADIFIKNNTHFLKKGGIGILMVKARSIDISLKPQDAYHQVKNRLITAGIPVQNMKELLPYDKDHAVLVTNTPPHQKNNI